MTNTDSFKTQDQAREVMDCFRAELYGKAIDLGQALNQYDDEALKYLASKFKYLAMRTDEVIKERQDSTN